MENNMSQERKLRENLESGDFLMKGGCALKFLLTKLDIIGMELSRKENRCVIQMKSGRLKSYESVCKKLEKKGLEKDFSTVLERINDLIGVRAICSYVDDIYRISEILENQSDVRILKKKDYIRKPKNSGYRSFHLILEVPIEFMEGIQWMKAELQLRTAAMDYWANLDHQLRYKRGMKEVGQIDIELKECAQAASELDRRLMKIRTNIEQI